MTNIEWVRDLLRSCPALKEAASIVVGQLQDRVDFFSIDPLPGGGVLSEDLDGTKVRAFPFTVSSCQCTADEASRLESNGTFEKLCEWMDEVTMEERLPEMGGEKFPDSIEATGWGYLFQREDDPSTAVYQISCRLVYTQFCQQQNQ